MKIPLFHTYLFSSTSYQSVARKNMNCYGYKIDSCAVACQQRTWYCIYRKNRKSGGLKMAAAGQEGSCWSGGPVLVRRAGTGQEGWYLFTIFMLICWTDLR
jgi:hypothetical protein